MTRPKLLPALITGATLLAALPAVAFEAPKWNWNGGNAGADTARITENQVSIGKMDATVDVSRFDFQPQQADGAYAVLPELTGSATAIANFASIDTDLPASVKVNQLAAGAVSGDLLSTGTLSAVAKADHAANASIKLDATAAANVFSLVQPPGVGSTAATVSQFSQMNANALASATDIRTAGPVGSNVSAGAFGNISTITSRVAVTAP